MNTITIYFIFYFHKINNTIYSIEYYSFYPE
jgi:hypothetical protein